MLAPISEHDAIGTIPTCKLICHPLPLANHQEGREDRMQIVGCLMSFNECDVTQDLSKKVWIKRDRIVAWIPFAIRLPETPNAHMTIVQKGKEHPSIVRGHELARSLEYVILKIGQAPRTILWVRAVRKSGGILRLIRLA